VTIITSPLLLEGGFIHGFGTRINTDTNTPSPIHILLQVHGERIVCLAEQTMRVQSTKFKVQSKNPKLIISEVPEEAFRFDEGDALITSLPGISIGIRTADCLPVLLADPATGTVAAVHCGWRSLTLDLAEKAVQAMASMTGNKPSGLLSALGPAINTCCYEVGQEVIDQFRGYSQETVPFTEREGRLYLDLRAIARSQLLKAGLSPKCIDDLDQCTSCMADRFFSHRARREEGRMVSFIQATG